MLVFLAGPINDLALRIEFLETHLDSLSIMTTPSLSLLFACLVLIIVDY